MKVLALLALAAYMVDQDMLVHADEVADDNTVPSDEQPLADTEGVGCYYSYQLYGSMCDGGICGSGYSSYSDCLCQSGTCSYSGYCTSKNYYYDFYNDCYNYVERGVGYYNDATDLVWLWWVISIVTTLIIVAVIITVVCCIRKKRR